MSFLEPITLVGEIVTLEPLRPQHGGELADAARDGELWNLWYTSVPRPEQMAADIDSRLGMAAAGSMLPLSVRRTTRAGWPA